LSPTDSVTVVIVTHDHAAVIGTTLEVLGAQLRAGDEIVVVDNASVDGTAAVVARSAPATRVIANARNEGFSAACNRGAEAAQGELLVFLNPDAVPAPGFCAAIRRPRSDGSEWAAWMGLVTTDGGRLINTSGGVVHFTGISWAGEIGRPADAAGAAREVAFLSGACMAVPRDTWMRHGGFSPLFFMYCEDVDLSLRLRLAGGRLGLEPAARVDHAYTFAKGAYKWRLLERNRWATIIRTYPAPLLAAVAPALVATEIALVGVSLAGGWAPQKLAAAIDTGRALRRLLRERRAIQAGRTIGAAAFAASLSAELSSPHLGRVGSLRPLGWALAVYWRAVRRVLELSARA